MTRLIHLILTAALTLASGTPVWAAEALSARLFNDDGANFVEVALDEPLGFRTFTLTDPHRIVVDFPELDWRFDPPRPGPGMSLIEGVRLGVTRRGAGRLVIDLKRPAAIAAAFTLPADGDAPPRFVLELRRTEAAEFDKAAAGEDAPATRADGWPVPIKRPKRAVVVAIDPGHGGRDAGASFGGLAEKDLVLDYAKDLAAVIDARPGHRAFLTRKDDEFVRLRERVARARWAGADLFLSIHADSLAKGAAAGASVYTLSEDASDEEAAALAASHNRADAIGGVQLHATEDDVALILVDFARRETDEASVALAETLVRRLEARSEVLRGRALQSAGFRVLKAPDVPSVLVEIGFLSAAKDRSRLTSKEGRARVIEALAEGVFEWVSLQTGERYKAAQQGGGG